jgi:hypothetical protein
MILKVLKAEYINNYNIKVFFNDNLEKIINLENELYGSVFELLKDKEYFKQFYIDCNTISWENGADFAPEYLHGLKEK